MIHRSAAGQRVSVTTLQQPTTGGKSNCRSRAETLLAENQGLMRDGFIRRVIALSIGGIPKHPLYLRGNMPDVRWQATEQ